MKLHYHLVDVFTNRPFAGNQLAVFAGGEELPAETMQALIRELNLSEATFVLPPRKPANAYRLRIFTPGKELPMAGHPTVGTTFVLVREGMLKLEGERTVAVLEEGVGDITVEIEGEGTDARMVWMTQPLPTFGPRIDDVEAVASALSLPIEAIDTRYPVQVVSTGVPFLYAPIASLDAIRAIRINRERFDSLLSGLDTTKLFVFTREVESHTSTVHSRMFAPVLGIMEDPATGAASGPLGAYLVKYGIVEAAPEASIVSEQGIEMGRPSYIHIKIEQQAQEITRVRIGGQCVYMGAGYFEVQ